MTLDLVLAPEVALRATLNIPCNDHFVLVVPEGLIWCDSEPSCFFYIDKSLFLPLSGLLS